MKASIGLLADIVPVFGYFKRSYIVIVSLGGSLSLAVLGSVDFPPNLAYIGAILIFIFFLQVATVDLITEGKYAQLMVLKPHTGSDLVSYVWAAYSIGMLLGATVAGPMSDYLEARFTFLVALPLAAQIVLPTLLGWIPERRLPLSERRVRSEKLEAHPHLVKLALSSTAAALATALAALHSAHVQFMCAFLTSITMTVLGVVWLPRTLRNANLYIFFDSILYIGLKGPLDYWYTADATCVPDGPHFSFTYYNALANIVSSASALIAVMLFQRTLSRGSFQTAFCTTIALKICTSVFDIAILHRVNLRFGVPDNVAFMLGDAVLFQAANILEFIPSVVLISKVCPPGIEAAVYALLASYQNLGHIVARALGVVMQDAMGIRTTSPCDFSALPKAVALGHCLIPAFSIPLVFLLVPNKKMTDDVGGLLESENQGVGDETRTQSGATAPLIAL